MWREGLPLVVAPRGVGGLSCTMALKTTEDHHLTLRLDLSTDYSYSGVCIVKHSSGLSPK